MKLSICSKFWRKKKGRKEGINRRKKEDPLFPRIRERKRKKTGFVSIFHGHSIQGREILVSRISRARRSRGRSRGNARCTHVQTCKQWEKGINEGRGGETENGTLYSYETRPSPFRRFCSPNGDFESYIPGKREQRAGSTRSICFPFLFFLTRAFNCENFIQFIPFTARPSDENLLSLRRRRINIFETIFWKDKGSKISMQKKKKNENVRTEINVARLKDRSRGIYRVDS